MIKYLGRVLPRSGLDPAAAAALLEDQAAAALAVLADGRRVSVINAPAGSGKTRVLAEIARIWAAGGGEVIGITPSQSARNTLAAGVPRTPSGPNPQRPRRTSGPPGMWRSPPSAPVDGPDVRGMPDGRLLYLRDTYRVETTWTPPYSEVRRPDTATTPGAPVTGTSPAVPDPSAERLAYSIDEAARLTGLSRDLLYDQMRRGNLPYVKIGRRRLISRQHLEQFLGVTS